MAGAAGTVRAAGVPEPPSVDVVVVGHNSRATLRGCIGQLANISSVNVFLVDTASADDAFDTVADLPVTAVRADRNGGFAYGCNIGIGLGRAPYVLLLNPDARLEPDELARLVAVLAADPGVALVAPRILGPGGATEPSQRRYPTPVHQFAKALFLHRLAPRAVWSDDVIRDAAAYRGATEPDWVSGACMLVRREALEAIGGLDEGFFLYSEDTDLCARLWAAGGRVRYEPTAKAIHGGGHSAPRSALRKADVRSLVRYALKHGGARRARLTALGLALGELTHLFVRSLRPGYLRGHGGGLAAALSAAVAPQRAARLARAPVVRAMRGRAATPPVAGVADAPLASPIG